MSHVTGGAYDFGPGWPDEDDEDELVYELPLEQQIQQHTSLHNMSTSHRQVEDHTPALDDRSDTEGFQSTGGYRPPPELRWYGGNNMMERGYRASTLRSSDYNGFASITPPSNQSSRVERLNRGLARSSEPTHWSTDASTARSRAYSQNVTRHNFESTVPPNIALSNHRRRESVLRPLDISMRETRLLLDLSSDNVDNDDSAETPVYPPVGWGTTLLMEIVDPSGKKCSICFNEPPEDVSALDCCTHTYCFECAKKWSNTRPVCPLCKRNFKRIYHDVKSNSEYKTYKVPTVPDIGSIYPNSEFRNLMYPLLHRRYIYWVTRFEHTRSRSRNIQTALPHVAGDENRSAAVLTGVSVDVLRMRRILYDRDVFTARVNGVVRDEVGGSFFANQTVEVHRIFPYIRRELIFLFGFTHQNLIGPLTRAIIPLLALPGLRTDSITQQLRPILGRYTERFLFEIVQFARTDCSLDSFESGYIYPAYMNNQWDSRIYREQIIPLPEDSTESSRIIRTALGQRLVKILAQVTPPLEPTGEATLNSEFVRNSERLVALDPISSRPRFNYAATRTPPRIPRVLLPSHLTSTRRPSPLQNLRRTALVKPLTRTAAAPHYNNRMERTTGSYDRPRYPVGNTATPLTSLLTSSSSVGSVTTSAVNMSAVNMSSVNMSSSALRPTPRAYSYSDNDECEIVDSYELSPSPPPPPQRSQQEPIDLTCPSSSSSSTEYTTQDVVAGGYVIRDGHVVGTGGVVEDERPSTSGFDDHHPLSLVRRRKAKDTRHQGREVMWMNRYSEPHTDDQREPDMVIDLTVPDAGAAAYDASNRQQQQPTANDPSILNVVDYNSPNSPPLVGESASGYTLHYSGVTSPHPIITNEPPIPKKRHPMDQIYPEIVIPAPRPPPNLPLRKRKAEGVPPVPNYTAASSTAAAATDNNDDDDEPSTKRKMRRPVNPAENALSQAFYDNLRRRDHTIDENFSDDDDEDDDDVIFNGYLRPPSQQPPTS